MKKSMLGAVVVGSVVFASMAMAEPPKIGPIGTIGPIGPAAGNLGQLVQSIPLACSGSGASDVVHRHHSIKNTTGKTILKGTKLHWDSSDKGHGDVALSANLAAGDSVDVGEPGQTNGYSCTAHFYPGPADWTIKSVAWNAQGTAAVVELQNLNAFADAPASLLRLQGGRCGVGLTATVNTNAPLVPKGGVVSVNVGLAKGNLDYLEATANASNLPEADKTNNSAKSADFNNNKSCTPW